jgi:hypothetical protein
MLEKTIAAVKADKAKTLDLINEGKGGFLDRDLYPFCFNLGDGKAIAVASPNSKQTLGKDIRTIKDSTGKELGLDLYAAAEKVTKLTFEAGVLSEPAKVGDLGCGVGYYK